MNTWTLLAAFACLVASALAYPHPYPMAMAFPDDSYHKPHNQYGHDIGRVKIQVFRGPNMEYGEGYKKESYAKSGFYVTQPLNPYKEAGYYSD